MADGHLCEGPIDIGVDFGIYKKRDSLKMMNFSQENL